MNYNYNYYNQQVIYIAKYLMIWFMTIYKKKYCTHVIDSTLMISWVMIKARFHVLKKLKKYMLLYLKLYQICSKNMQKCLNTFLKIFLIKTRKIQNNILFIFHIIKSFSFLLNPSSFLSLPWTKKIKNFNNKFILYLWYNNY